MDMVSVVPYCKMPDAKDTVVRPFKAYEHDAGWDITCNERHIIWPLQCVDISSGWRVFMPLDIRAAIRPRSSTSKLRKLIVMEGTIDPGYQGVLSVVVFNPNLWPRIVRPGDRLAQIVFVKAEPVQMTEVDYDFRPPPSERRSRGFGSSGGVYGD